MNHEHLFQDFLADLSTNWQPLSDKLEETPEATLRTLWFLAVGERRALERCIEEELPVLSEPALDQLKGLINQRLAGVPLAHLTGHQCFMDVEMLAGPEALIPRKETEILGYAALDILRKTVATNGNARVIDLCTGCGNLALALAYHEPNCQIFAADLSPEAVDLAQRNAKFLRLEDRVEFHVGDLFAPFDHDGFLAGTDLVVCNPPYISTQHITEMPEEIHAHEPHLAFDGGPFGVAIVFRLIKEAPRFLKPKSWLCFEVGLGQGDLITRRMARTGDYTEITPLPDANGAIRAIMARRI
jgi:release factor glutamine methyltransferase